MVPSTVRGSVAALPSAVGGRRGSTALARHRAWWVGLLLALVLVGLASSRAAWAQDTPAVAAPVYRLGPAMTEVAENPLFTEASVAVQVVDLENGEEVWAHNGDTPLVPASVMKVLTSAAGLKVLGPTYRFSTEFLADEDAEINEDGVLEGDLYLRGTGDPTLVVEKLWKMLKDLQVAGVLEVNGDIIFDQSWFDDQYLIPGWNKKADLEAGPAYFAPVGALSFNFNTVSIVVRPGRKVDEPPEVLLETPAKVIALDTEKLVTVKARKRGWIVIEREVDPRTHLVTFKLEGEVPLGSDAQRHYRAVGNPLAWTMSAFSDLIKAEGIKYTGRFRVGEAPDEAQSLVRLLSPPLHEILNHTNKYSSNFMAEHVLKTLGAVVHEKPGTTANGVKVVESYLEELGVPLAEVQLVNGSGLSRDIRLAPSHVNAVLMDVYHNPALRPEFLSSLAVGGVDGTLRHRFNDDGEPARVRGKTGSLNGVYCLAAFVRGGDGKVYAFTLLANDLRRSRPARALQDQIGTAIMTWTGAPPPPEAP